MKLKCPACGAPIPSVNVNIQNMIAVCTNCDNIIELNTALQRQGNRRKIQQPEQFTYYEDDSKTHLSFKWSWRTEPKIAFVVMMAVLCAAVALPLTALASGEWNPSLLFTSLMGIYPTYYAISLLYNSTHYVADSETLKVYTTPFWFPRYGKQTLLIDDITEVTVKNTYNMGNDADSFYHVYARTIDGKQHAIAAYVNYEHAHYIMQELQEHLLAVQTLSTEIFGHNDLIENTQDLPQTTVENSFKLAQPQVKR